MKNQPDPIGERRGARTMSELDKARSSMHQGGATGAFLRIALVVLFMFLVVMSYQALGIYGPVFISVLFLIAVFVPFLYLRAKKRRQQEIARQKNQVKREESFQET